MKTEFETRTGHCAEHGTVEAERELPKPSFPFALYAWRRYRARQGPFRCPDCGAPVDVDHALMGRDTP